MDRRDRPQRAARFRRRRCSVQNFRGSARTARQTQGQASCARPARLPSRREKLPGARWQRQIPAGTAAPISRPLSRRQKQTLISKKTPNQTNIMPFDTIKMEEIRKARRKAIAESIRTISTEELKALGATLFPGPDQPWRREIIRV